MYMHYKEGTLSSCVDDRCYHYEQRRVLGRTHGKLSKRFDWYHTWHHHPHHKKAHGAVAVIHTAIMLAIVVANALPSGVLAADTVWSFGTPGDYTVSDAALAEIAGSTAKLKVRNYTPDANTVALYHLDEANGSSAADSSSNNNTGTVTGGTFGTGNLNNGLALNGTSEQISIADSASLSLTQANTIEAWTKFNSAFSGSSHSQRQGIVDKGNYQLYYDHTSSKIKYELAPSAASTWAQVGGDGLNGSWDQNGQDLLYDIANINSTVYVALAGATGTTGRGEVWSWNGTTWTHIGGNGVNGSWTGVFEAVRSLTAIGSTLYAGLGESAGDGEVWSWNGSTWTKIGGDGMNSGWLANYDVVESLTAVGTDLYAGLGLSASEAEVWKWNGTSWSQVGGDSLNSSWGAGYEVVESMTVSGTTLYAGLGASTGDAEVWALDTDTVTWTKIGGDAANSSWADATFEYVRRLVVSGSTVYAGLGSGTGDAEVWSWNGTSWTKIGGDSVNSGWGTTYDDVLGLAVDGSTLYAGLGLNQGENEVWSWNGTSWTQIGGDNLNSGWSTNAAQVRSLHVVSGILYAHNTSPNAYPSDMWTWNGTSWTQIAGGHYNNSWGPINMTQIRELATHNGKLYAGTGISTTLDGGGAHIYEWDGTTWTRIGGEGKNSSWGPKTNESVYSMQSFAGELYVGLYGAAGDADLWKWNGTTWSQVGGDNLNSGWGTSYEGVLSLAVHNNELYAGLGVSSNADAEVWSWNGTTWTKIGGDSINSGWAGRDIVESLVSYGGNLYAGLSDQNGNAGEAIVWMWNGTSWTQVGGDGVNSSWDATTYEDVTSMAVYNGSLYAGLGVSTGDAEVWSYNGSTWTKVGGDSTNSGWGAEYESVPSLAVYNGDLYASLANTAGDGEVWKYDGSSWGKIGGDSMNSGWSDLVESVYSLTVYDGKLYAGLGDTVDVDAEVWAYGNNSVLSSTTLTQDTNWHHIAATYDGTTMRLYVDGALNASATASVTMADGAKPLLIGTSYGGPRNNGSQGYFAGSLDEVRISNIARSSLTSTAYANSAQTVQPTAAVLTSGVASWDGFSTNETANGGTITYRLSSDNGTTWKYHTGGAWTTSSSTSQANPANTVNSNISTFPISTGGLLWQAVLLGNGSQQVTLNSVTVTYTGDAIAPTNPTAAAGENSNGGGVSLTTNTWYNYGTPYFSWTGADDPGGSGVQGYFVYFGTDNTADPTTAGAFQVAANYTAGSLVTGTTYYLRIKTRDNAQNVTATAYSAFTYKYDATVPTNPAFVSVNPSGYTSTNNFTFIWPSTGGSAAADTHSGVAGYQYKTGASSGPLSTYSATTGVTEINIPSAAYQEGANTFYLRVIDTAGNASNPITATFYYNASAPTAPQNVNTTPGTNTANSFAFSWTAPASFSGNANELTYYYSINTLPQANTVTSAGNATSLAAGAYATQQGTNTFYVVAKDAANNINYSAYGSATFTANTTAPGQPLNLTIADSTNRTSEQYRLSLTWEAPSSGGAVNRYAVHRATDGATFGSVGTTTSAGYIDTNLSTDITYSYKIFAIDSAGATSVASSVVSKKPTGKFTEPPTITTPPAATVGATSVTITWKTDRNSDAFVEYGTTTDYGLNFGQRESKTDHEVKIIGLTPGTIYHYRVQSLDPGDLRDYSSDAGKSSDFTFETTAAPGLSNVSFSDITTNSAILSFDTSKAATSTIEYGTSTNYGSTITDESGGGTTKHTLRLKDLTDGTTYQMRISIKDADGNTVSSPGHAFTTLAKPKISNVRFETLPNTAQTTVKVTWTTNVATTGSVQYSSDTAKPKEVATSEYKTEHEFIVSGLLDQSTYQFQAVSRDTFGNTAVSDTNSVKTPSDSRPPELKNLTVEVRSSGVSTGQKAQLVVSWETDEPATSMIEYGPGLSSDTYTGRSQEDTALTTTHVVIVSELEPSKLYHLRAVSKDRAGNPGYSADTTAITGKMQRSVVDIILNSLQRSFSFFSKLAK